MREVRKAKHKIMFGFTTRIRIRDRPSRIGHRPSVHPVEGKILKTDDVMNFNENDEI